MERLKIFWEIDTSGVEDKKKETRTKAMLSGAESFRMNAFFDKC